jgi:hypothetical protein
MNDGAVKFDNCAIIERPLVRCAHAVDHFALARVIAKRNAGFLFRFADFQGDARAFVEQSQQFAIQLVNSASPIVDAHLENSIRFG